MLKQTLTLDAAATARRFDENGYLHVAASHITKAAINPYYGHEIPGWEAAGLEPQKIYQGLRHPDELQKSLPTWAGLPLHVEHHIDSADDPQKLSRVGAVGTEITWNPPYIDAPLVVWDAAAIAAIENGTYRELSCAYRYEPDFTPGEYNGQPYDFIMRNIRGNHVALVEEGRAGPDVLVADSKPEPETKRGKFMGKLKNWFRGARDADPDIERKETDLSQAIIELYTRGLLRGELCEGREDGGLSARRGLLKALESQLPPEERERLLALVASLAPEAEGADDAPEDLPKLEPQPEKSLPADEEQVAAMQKAGLDADDPSASNAFAEGVKYGEELEKNPVERARLDREHESEGMKKAMDRCGLDAENPAEAQAFAEGVKYGEEKERGEAAKLDQVHECAGKDAGKEALLEKILAAASAALPDLTPEQCQQLKEALSAVAGPAADPADSEARLDEKLDEKIETAQDRALRKRRFLGAADAARIRAQATADAMEHMRAVHIAAQKVRSLVGEVNPMAFDSAREVYGYALKQLGRKPERYDPRAWEGICDAIITERANSGLGLGGSHAGGMSGFASDSRMPDSGPFARLKNIILS